MILGQVIFGPEIVLRPTAVVDSTVREFGLGIWKTLGLEVLLEPLEFPEPCLDFDEMRRRNEESARMRSTLEQELDKCS